MKFINMFARELQQRLKLAVAGSIFGVATVFIFVHSGFLFRVFLGFSCIIHKKQKVHISHR